MFGRRRGATPSGSGNQKNIKQLYKLSEAYERPEPPPNVGTINEQPMEQSSLKDPLLQLPGVRHQSSHSVHGLGEVTSSSSQRQSPCTLKLAQDIYLSGARSGGGGGDTGKDEILLIRHTWNAFRHRVDFWLHDQFHVLMSLPFRYLVVVLVICESCLALFLAFTLWLMTWGDVQRCLGDVDDSIANYYYFAIETMFTVGFGAPRHPSCTAANLWTSVAVLFTNVVHGCVVGIVFSKFSSGATRRYALAFSPSLLGCVAPSVPPAVPWTPQDNTVSTQDQTKRQWSRLHSNFYSVNGFLKSIGPPCTPGGSGTLAEPAEVFLPGLRPQSPSRGYQFSDGLTGNYVPPSETHPHLCPKGLCCHLCGSLAVDVDSDSEREGGTSVCPAASPALLNQYGNLSFSLSFRMMNLTECAFFDPKLSIFLMRHDSHDLTICQLTTFYTDMPLQFLELPITVTIGDAELKDAFGQNGCSEPITLAEIATQGDKYELIVLISFVDNQSSRLLELRKSWKLSQIQWGYSFQRIVKKAGKGIAYQVDVECLDNKIELVDSLNLEFANVISKSRAGVVDLTPPSHPSDPFERV